MLQCRRTRSDDRNRMPIVALPPETTDPSVDELECAPTLVPASGGKPPGTRVDASPSLGASLEPSEPADRRAVQGRQDRADLDRAHLDRAHLEDMTSAGVSPLPPPSLPRRPPPDPWQRRQDIERLAPWWRRALAFLSGRPAPPRHGPARTAPVLRPKPVDPPADPPPSRTSPFESPAPWEGAEALLDADLGPTRMRLIERLYTLREEATNPNDWRFIDRVIRACSASKLDFPLFPQGAIRLDRLLRSGNPPRAKVVELIRQEPGLVQRVWMEGRSANFGASRPISLDEAIVRVGHRRIWEIAMSACMNGQVFRVRNYQATAHHLRALSIVAAEVSHVYRGREDVFLPTLLHALGKLVVYRCGVGRGPEEGATPAFVCSIADRLYPSIGVLVAEAWELGPAVAAGIGFAPAPEQAPAAYRDVAFATRAASISAHEAWAEGQRRSFDGYRALLSLSFPPTLARRGLDEAEAAWRRVPAMLAAH